MMEKYNRSIYRINRELSGMEEENDNEDNSIEDGKNMPIVHMSESPVVHEIEKEYSINEEETSDIECQINNANEENTKYIYNDQSVQVSKSQISENSENSENYKNTKQSLNDNVVEKSQESGSECSISATVRIPQYSQVGVGRNSYVEYEVEIDLPGSHYVRKFFRRFSQFRDLHRRLCSNRTYGKTVSRLAFPNRRVFFSLSTAVSNSRQKDLQSYLSTMLTTCYISTREELDVLDIFFRAT